MTKEERIKRYTAIVKWGREFVDSVDRWSREEHKDFYNYDRQLLTEYEQGLAELKAQKDA